MHEGISRELIKVKHDNSYKPCYILREMAFNDAYGQRWKSIREWEEKFIEGEGRKNIATVLRDVWENWINYGWGSYKDSEKFGQRRTDLFGAYVEGEITDSEVVGEVTNYPMGG